MNSTELEKIIRLAIDDLRTQLPADLFPPPVAESMLAQIKDMALAAVRVPRLQNIGVLDFAAALALLARMFLDLAETFESEVRKYKDRIGEA